jgi:hypothetical protein
MNHVLRLILALAFLASGTLGAVAGTHGFCDQASGASQHKHDAPAEPVNLDADLAKKDASDSQSSGEVADFGARCHTGGSGCPGCVTPAEQAFYNPVVMKAAYHHPPVSGQSADLTANRRPPKFS